MPQSLRWRGHETPWAKARWVVLDRLSWFTYDDALVLERAALRFFAGRSRGDGWAHSNDVYHCARAAQVAGGHRYTDGECIEAIAGDTCDLIRPQRCAVGPNAAGPAAFTADSAPWCDVVASCATTAAWALLVVDQVDAGPFSQAAYACMTGPWVTAFGDPTTATAIPPAGTAGSPQRGPARPIRAVHVPDDDHPPGSCCPARQSGEGGDAVSTPATRQALAGLVTDELRGLDGAVHASATFSPDAAKTHRYVLTRTWGSGTRIGWLMLNPSTADALVDDKTIGRCTSYSRRWGAGGLVVVNLFALRSTDPGALRGHPDPVGVSNDEAILAQLADDHLATVVAAWGAHPFAAARARHVTDIFAAQRIRLQCLGATRNGHPRHPCRLPDGVPLRAYPTPPAGGAQ
ncbi:MAG: hypothetical protein V7603_5171 [Micromonosporaceae bacterium]